MAKFYDPNPVFWPPDSSKEYYLMLQETGLPEEEVKEQKRKTIKKLNPMRRFIIRLVILILLLPLAMIFLGLGLFGWLMFRVSDSVLDVYRYFLSPKKL